MDREDVAFLSWAALAVVAFILGGALLFALIGHVFGIFRWWFTGEYPHVHPWMEGTE